MTIDILPGRSLVRLESRYDQASGPIILPDQLKSEHLSIGRVIDSKMTIKDMRHIGADLWKKRVIVTNSVGVCIDEKEKLYVYPNLVELCRHDGTKYKPPRYSTPFAAIIDDDVQLGQNDEVPRCQSCGPANSEKGRGNMMMVKRDGEWVCPRCGK